MKRRAKILLSTLAVLIILFGSILLFNYAPDKSFEELKDRWAYDNSEFVEVEDMQVHYRKNGNGPKLVLIHGTGASLHTWEDWTKYLERDFEVISLDLPAYGLTGPNQTGVYDMAYYTSFLDRFFEKLEIDSCFLAGNSLGGQIAWEYAARFPEKVRKLILLDAAGYPRTTKAPMAISLAKNKVAAKMMLKITPKALFEKSMREVYYNDELVTDNIIERYYELFLREGNRQAYIDRINSGHDTDLEMIKTIQAPTLILWGKYDIWIPLEFAHRFESDIPNSELIIYENAGHVPMEEIPERSAKDARNFLLNLSI